MAEPVEPDCEHGYHAPLVACDPVQLDGCVNVAWVCPACGAHEYTTSWTDEAWRAHLDKEAAAAEKAAKRPKPRATLGEP